jgi:RNA polymerase sigma-70 factor (ECF subfamily)
MVRLSLGDRRLAEDIVQETYLRAWHFIRSQGADVWHGGDGRRDGHGGLCDCSTCVDGLRPWLYTVARRLLIDILRKRDVRPAEVLVDVRQVPGCDDQIERMLVGRIVRAGLKELRSEHRDVLVESYYRGRTSREIAAVLDIPEGTVKSRIFYALRALRGVVDPHVAL